MVRGQLAETIGPHGPGVEIDGLGAGDAGEDGAVDIVGPGLGGSDLQAAATQGREQAEGDQRLAGTGPGGGDDQAVGQRGSSPI